MKTLKDKPFTSNFYRNLELFRFNKKQAGPNFLAEGPLLVKEIYNTKDKLGYRALEIECMRYSKTKPRIFDQENSVWIGDPILMDFYEKSTIGKESLTIDSTT